MRVFLGTLLATLTLSNLAGAQLIDISSLERAKAEPFSTLVITGSGFLPATSAISALILPNAGATNACSSPAGGTSPGVIPVAVPVYAATSTTLKIIVPPLLNVANGQFTTAAVQVQVVQVSATSLSSSQRVTDLCISQMPQVPRQVPAGAVTRAYLNMGLNALSDVLNRNLMPLSLKAKLRAFEQQQKTLATQVGRIVNNSNDRIPIATKDELPFVLDAEILATADRLIVAQLEQFFSVLQAQSSGFTRASRVLAKANCKSQPNLTDHIFDLLCVNDVRREQLAAKTPEEQAEQGMQRTAHYERALAGWWAQLNSARAPAVDALAAKINAEQLLFVGQVPYFAAIAVLNQVPPLSKPLDDTLSTIIQSALFHGRPVGSATHGAIAALKGILKLSRKRGSSPQGGIVTSAPTSNLLGTPQAVYRFQNTGSSDSTLPIKLSVWPGQATVTIADATISSDGVRRFDGTYEGNFNGTLSGPAAATVAPARTGKSTASDFLDDLPIRPVAVGDPFEVSNAHFSVTLDSSRYVHFSDFQILYMWATVENLGDSEDKFSFELTSKVPKGWSHVDESSGSTSIWLQAGKSDEVKFMASPEYTRSKKATSTFKYRVTSDKHGTSLIFSFQVVAIPQMSNVLNSSTAGWTDVAGTVTDAVTGDPIVGAEITLWLGHTTRMIPFDMMNETDSVGAYSIACWDVNILNEYYKPYVAVEGYRLVVQKAGYKTYVHDEYVAPEQASTLTRNIQLVPLQSHVEFELKWKTALSSPGAWWIKVSDAWDRFAVALGKHPDPGDDPKLPSRIPFIDDKGKVLWEKKLPDESWAIDMTRDGSYVASATNSLEGNNFAYLWDAAGNEVWKKTLPGESYDVRFSPDGLSVATGPHEDNGAGLVLYDTLTGEEKWNHAMGGTKVVRQTAFLKKGKYVLAGQPLHLYRANGKLVWRRYHPYLPYAIWPSSNGSRIMVPDKGDSLSMFSLRGKLLWRREQRVITYGAMSANASVVVITTTHGYIYCYDKKGKIKWYHLIPGGRGTAGHNAIDITPDGKYIVVGAGGYTTILYDSRGNVLWRHAGDTPYDQQKNHYQQSVMAVRISPDGKKIASGYGTLDPMLSYFEKTGQ
jgi:hypothetical protein